MKNIVTIAEKFNIGKVSDIREYGSGIINETFLVENKSGEKFILQKQHRLIGKEVLEDIEAVTKILESKNIITPKIIPTKDGKLYVINDESIWRTLTFIDGKSYKHTDDTKLIKSAGRLIGTFHNALVGTEYTFKHQIPHFHKTDFHINKLKQICSDNIGSEKYKKLNKSADYIIEEYENNEWALNMLPDRIIHGDLKVSNVRFDEKQEHATVLLDLDTLGKDKIVIDIGDAVRSFCNNDNKFDLEIFKSWIEGYFSSASFITKEEKNSIPAGIETFILELAARYITDAFEEKYFKLDQDKYSGLFEQNKTKAESLIVLYKDFESKTEKIEGIISSTTSP